MKLTEGVIIAPSHLIKESANICLNELLTTIFLNYCIDHFLKLILKTKKIEHFHTTNYFCTLKKFFKKLGKKKFNKSDYWRFNIKYVTILLTVWFTVSYGFGILLVEQLNQFKIGGFLVGFWFSQQGSIYVFVILIFIYIYLMNKLDKKFK